jgi:hypothetical protein
MRPHDAGQFVTNRPTHGLGARAGLLDESRPVSIRWGPRPWRTRSSSMPRLPAPTNDRCEKKLGEGNGGRRKTESSIQHSPDGKNPAVLGAQRRVGQQALLADEKWPEVSRRLRPEGFSGGSVRSENPSPRGLPERAGALTRFDPDRGTETRVPYHLTGFPRVDHHHGSLILRG